MVARGENPRDSIDHFFRATLVFRISRSKQHVMFKVDGLKISHWRAWSRAVASDRDRRDHESQEPRRPMSFDVSCFPRRRTHKETVRGAKPSV